MSFLILIILRNNTNGPELRFNAAGFGWKSYTSETGEPLTFSGGDVRSASWARVARGFQVRLGLRQGGGDAGRVGFEGFKRDVSMVEDRILWLREYS